MSGIRVLHVDDEPSFADVVAEFLERQDDRLEVVTESRASAGLDRLETNGHEIDCVVSDYDMPRMDGLALLDAVRGEFPELPFILFTGKGSEEVASDAIAGGATDYLQKASGTEQYELLANRIRNAVSQYRSQREHERVYQALETATQGIGILDADGTYIYLNEAYAELYGSTPDELAGTHWEQLYPDDEVDRFYDEILPALETQGSWSGRSTGVRADGSTFTEQLSLTQLDTGGHVCVVQDLSERMQRERELRRKERRYRAIFEDPNILVGLLGPDGRLQRVNQTAIEYIEDDRDAVIGQPFWETPWWNEPPQLQAALQDWIGDAAAGDYVEYEVSHELADDAVNVNGTVRPVTDGDGEVISLIVSARDVTERKQRERELEWKTNAMDEAPIGIVITDPDREDNPIVYANEQFAELTGYPADEVTGRNCRFLQGPETDPEPVATMRTAIDTAEPVSVELRNYRKDGSVFWNRVTIAPVEDDAGTVTHFVGFQEDVTERKHREHRLQQRNDRFDDLAEVVAHDLQTPLATARGRLESVEDGDHERVDRALAALDRVDDLREDIETVLRTRELVSETEPVDIESVTADAWESVETSGNASMEVVGEPHVGADPGACRRLLENLLANSVEHGDTDISVRIEPIDGGFSYEDDGPGIRPAIRDDVFMPGFSTKDETKSGVGMTSIEQIVEAHGWQIRIAEPEQLGGVRFEIQE